MLVNMCYSISLGDDSYSCVAFVKVKPFTVNNAPEEVYGIPHTCSHRNEWLVNFKCKDLGRIGKVTSSGLHFLNDLRPFNGEAEKDVWETTQEW